MHAADTSRRQYPPSTSSMSTSSMSMRSSRHHHHHGAAPPPSASASGPLTAERHMMEQIRLKLERAQQRLEHRHAVESTTPGSARYYPPNYTSAQAKHPAPPVQSVKLEDLSHQYASNSTASSSGYLGAYPPPSARDPYASQRRAPPTNSTRPTRQHAPPPSNYVPSSSRTHHHHHQPQSMSRREYRQQYPPELQYRSASRNPQSSRGGPEQFTGAPLSTSAPFLAYSSSRHAPHEKKLQNPPTSAIEVPPALLQPANQKTHRQDHHHGESEKEKDKKDKKDKKDTKRDESPPPEAPPASAVRATMASAMRSPVQPPPSSRVRFEGYPSPPESEEARAKRKEHEAEKARERQREKDKQLRDVLRQERQRRSVSRDAADAHDRVEKEQRTEGRTRRGSLPAPPKSEIDVSAFEQAALVLPVSPSGRTRRSSAAAAPPKSVIQVSAFDEAPVRRRSSAADEQHAAKQQRHGEEELAVSTGALKPAKRNAHSDDDDYRTPPTSPSSGGSASVPGSMVAAKEEAPPIGEAPTEAVLPISVKAVEADYDDAMPFVASSNQQEEEVGGLQSPSREKKPFLSIWNNDDEDAIISVPAALSRESNNQKPQSPAHHEPDPRLWAMRDEPEEEKPQVSNQEEKEEQQVAAPVLEFSDDPISPSKETELAVEAPPSLVKEDTVVATETSSNQELSPVTKPPAVSSRTPGSRSNRPDLRSRISAAIQAFNAPENGQEGVTKSPLTRTRSPVTEPRQPRSLSPALPPPSRPSSSFMSQRPPNTTTAAGAGGSMTSSSLRPTLTPTVTRPRPPLPPPPSSHSGLPAPPTTQGRRLRHKEPLELKRQLPPQIGVLAGLASGPTTFTIDEYAFYEIEWKVGEFGFSFQRVYAEPDPYDGVHAKREMYLRMLLNTDRSTCKSFRDVHVGDILIQIGDTKVSDLGFDSLGARDSGSALTKYFTELRTQTPMRLVFQRTEVLDWEGGVEL